MGAVWLIAAGLFVLTAGLLVADRVAWRRVAVVAAVVSTAVIGLTPSQYVAGLIANALVLAAVAGALYLEARRQRRPTVG